MSRAASPPPLTASRRLPLSLWQREGGPVDVLAEAAGVAAGVSSERGVPAHQRKLVARLAPTLETVVAAPNAIRAVVVEATYELTIVASASATVSSDGHRPSLRVERVADRQLDAVVVIDAVVLPDDGQPTVQGVDVGEVLVPRRLLVDGHRSAQVAPSFLE